MISTVFLDGPGGRREIASLSPLAVVPDQQRGGVGSMLVNAAVAIADTAEEPFVVLEGAPGYYGRLGFEPSIPLGVVIDVPDWAPPEAAQLRRLRCYDRSITGTVAYTPAMRSVIDG